MKIINAKLVFNPEIHPPFGIPISIINKYNHKWIKLIPYTNREGKIIYRMEDKIIYRMVGDDIGYIWPEYMFIFDKQLEFNFE